jgi:hypothetical protein
MKKLSLKENDTVIVARAGSAEKLLTIAISRISSDGVELAFEDSSGVSIQTSEEWEHQQSAKSAAKLKHGPDRPRERAAYTD